MSTLNTDPAARRHFRHAIVAGGSIAGLLAARVLSEHFDRVTLLERDAISSSPEPRRGVPQGRHLHALLARGRTIVEELFPGITRELCDAGAILVDAGRDLRWHHSGGWRARTEGELEMLCMSRPLLESRIAAHLRALPNVIVREKVRVVGVTSDDSRTRVTGLRVLPAEGHGAASAIECDLVVDALGRGSPVGQWLRGLGFAAPETELLPARVAYATCLFERSNTDPRPVLISGSPDRRSGGMFPIEGDRWLMTLIGFFEEAMPRTHDDFLSFARSLPAPDLWEAARRLRPVSDIVSYRFGGSQRRRYERLGRLPSALISMGDAVCSFNPVYGQGMTVSAIEAQMLGTALAEADMASGPDASFVKQWYSRIAPVVEAAWNGVAIEDLRFPQLAHLRPARLRPMQWYMRRVHRATHRNAAVCAQFYRVMSFLDSPMTLFSPRIILDVLLGRRSDAVSGSGREAISEASFQGLAGLNGPGAFELPGSSLAAIALQVGRRGAEHHRSGADAR